MHTIWNRIRYSLVGAERLLVPYANMNTQNTNPTFIHIQPANSQTGGVGTASDSAPSSVSCRGRKRVRSVHSSAKETEDERKAAEKERRAALERENKTPRWYVLRATHGRAKAVYDELMRRQIPGVEFYIAVHYEKRYNQSFDDPQEELIPKYLLPNWVFVHCSKEQYKMLFINMEYPIPGLSVCYDKCRHDTYGINPFLYIPDYQMCSFRAIVDSYEADVVVDQAEVPEYLAGERVRILGGPFKGVEGFVMRWKKQQKRVFVLLQGIGCVGTTYVPNFLLEKITD